jgi:hypothetical protein
VLIVSATIVYLPSLMVIGGHRGLRGLLPSSSFLPSLSKKPHAHPCGMSFTGGMESKSGNV